MGKSTDLFCHTVLFAKFNMLASFIVSAFSNICVFLQIEREHTPQQDFPVEQGHSVLPHKMWRDLFLKYFMAGGSYFLVGANLLGDCSI